MACRPTSQIRAARPAFTLVELLVVIAIIALLAAVLLPVLGRAYRLAKSSADAALIHQIAMGCEAYNQVFKQYPPSTWAETLTGYEPDDRAIAWPPPTVPATGTFGGVMPLTGAAKAHSALSGFNAIQCWDDANVLAWNPLEWDNPCGVLTSRGIIVDLTPGAGGDTEDKIYGPYYVPDEKATTVATITWTLTPKVEDQQVAFASRFTRNSKVTPPAGGRPENGAPILYYRAATAPQDADGDGIEPWEIYSWRDNHPITDPTDATSGSWGAYDADASTHPLYVTSDGVRPDGTLADTDGDGKADIFGIARPGSYGAGATGQVYNATTFILISPGPDGEYFTADDITNFRS